MSGKTLFDKLWDSHVVDVAADGTSLLYVDRHFVIEVTSAQAYEGLRMANRRVRRPDAIIAMPDHVAPTRNRERGVVDPIANVQMKTLASNIATFGALHYYPMEHRLYGIAHVTGPEQGATLPGMTVACGDSHTTTHGALGALAFGIGTSEVELVLASQCLSMKRLKNMRVNIEGELPPGVTAKDIALALIAKVGTGGGVGHAIEYTGSTVRAMTMEARMTLCNMAIEAGARAGMVAVDSTTLDYVRGRLLAPVGEMWTRAEAWWRELHSDEDAVFDKVVEMDAAAIDPQVSWGTSPELVVPIGGRLPDPADEPDLPRREWLEGALRYMGLAPGMRAEDIRIDKVFIGSCANARIEDLRAAAQVLQGRRIAPNVRLALVVPGSAQVKLQGEREGLDRVFRDAGFEWRDAGCSMCVGINEDRLEPGERCASTSNRNFEGRQGAGGRTHLLSPAMAAAAAIAGHLADVRKVLANG